MPDSQPGKMIFSNSQFFLLKRFSISQIFVCRFLIRSVESSLVENFQFLKNQMKILRHSDGWITRGSLYWNLRPVVALLNALNRPHFDYSSTPCATKRIQKETENSSSITQCKSSIRSHKKYQIFPFSGNPFIENQITSL